MVLPESAISSPIVSVIVPVYNAEKYLSETLSDLLSQTLRDVEFIFVDDGSTDSSLAILQSAAEKDSRIRILHQEHKYAGCARNLGISVAKGKWFIALDADDRFEPDLLESAVVRGEEVDAQIVIFDADVLINGELLARKTLAYAAQLPFGVFKPNEDTFGAFGVTATWTKLYRLDFIREGQFLYQETFESNDIRFTIHTMARADRVVALPRVLLHYRQGITDNVQSGKDEFPFDVVKAYRSLYSMLEKDNLWEEFRKIYITRALISLVMGRALTFNSVVSAREWFEQMQRCFMKELGLDSISRNDIVGLDADVLWRRYNIFISMSFEEWLWVNIKNHMDKELKLNIKVSSFNKKIKILDRRLKLVSADMLKNKKKNHVMASSFSYRVGRFLTLPFRVVYYCFASYVRFLARNRVRE